LYDVQVTNSETDFIVVGTVYQAPTPDALQVLSDVAVVVNSSGVISDIFPSASQEAAESIRRAKTVVRLGASERLMPGLIDTHVHAPQWPQLGTGLDLPLEQWLFDYTFPLEARYADPAYAHSVWSHMVPTFLRHGTTTSVYYATTHEESTRLLAEICVDHGQRAYVGRVAMDHPEGTPEWYRDATAQQGIEDSQQSIENIRAIAGNTSLVSPIITPRFIPACTDELLMGLGELAESTNTLVQTHCSESHWEHGYVLERFGRSDTEMLKHFGLLRRGTVLAHGVHIGDSDYALIKTAEAGVAHCPMSNSYFANGVFPARRVLAMGVNVGLGTDISAGTDVGLLKQCVHAVTSSRMLEDGVNGIDGEVSNSRIDIVAAFHMATAGGAQMLGLNAGVLVKGNQFDAIVVDVSASDSGMRNDADIDTDARVFEKIVRLSGPRDISHVWVAGKKVKQ
jgi:guanine deaminase